MKANQSSRIVRIGPVLVLSILVALRLADAAVVRGKLQHQGALGDVTPAPGISVTVSNAQGQRSGSSSSDNQGVYSLSHVPPGVYRLEVWAKPGGQPETFEIQVVSLTTDLEPINLP